MKVTYLSAILASSLLMFGCNSDNDDDVVVIDPPVVVVPPVVVPPVVVPPVVVIPPVTDGVSIDDASSVIVKLDTFDAITGALSFTVANNEGKALVGVANYDIVYFGFPDPTSQSIKPKAWKRWHVTQNYQCDGSDSCTGTLEATDTAGKYTFNVSDLDLQSKASANAVMIYKVAVHIKGTLASNTIELISAD